MDIDPTSHPISTEPSSTPVYDQGLSVGESSSSSHNAITTPVPVRGPTRTLRARQSLPQASSSAVNPSFVAKKSIRSPSQKELDIIHNRLGPQGLQTRREELIKEKEAKLRDVVDGHDTAVREKFHLERYISLLEGWDPHMAKQEQSPVFHDYKREYHNLLDRLPPSAASAVAGPSRPRTSLPARTTRRQAHEKAELFSARPPTPPPTTSSPVAAVQGPKGNGKVKLEESHAEPVNGKGKAKVTDDDRPSSSRSRHSVGGSANGEMPPPPIPAKKGKGRRATMGPSETRSEAEPEEPKDEPSIKGKKKGRMSLPNLPAKPLRAQQMANEKEASSPAVDSPGEAKTPAETREPSPTPVPLPSLAHLPFPPPPFRPRERLTGPKEMWYTDPTQLPPPLSHDGELWPILESYILIEDSGHQLDLKALELRAAKDAYFHNRVNYLQQQGRMSRLLDEYDDGLGQKKSHQKATGPPSRLPDHQESLMSHMVQIRNAMMNEAKFKPILCKRIARMVMAHWEHEEGKEERERLAEERERKRKARDIMRALKKRWGLAVKVVRARVIEKQKLEQDRLGKEHLQNMLQRSTGLLEAQRDDIAGQGRDEEEDDESDGTDEVSAAEDSEEQGDEEEAGEYAEMQDEEGDDNPTSTPAALEVALGVEGGEIEEKDLDVDVIGEASEEENDDEQDEDQDNEEDEDDEDEGEDEDGVPGTNTRDLLMDDQEDDGSAGDEDTRLEEEILDPASHGLDSTPIPISDAAASTTPLADSQVELDLQADEAAGVDALSSSFVETESLTAIPPAHADPSSNTSIDNEALPPSTNELITTIAANPEHSIGDAIVPQVNGHTDLRSNGHNPTIPLPNGPTSSPAKRSRRVRKSRSVSIVVKTEDPDANDAEFEDISMDLGEQDRELDVEMEDEEGDVKEEDSEDEGLLADADLPIEELLKRYGYPAPAADMNGAVIEGEQKDIVTDKSLLDESLDATVTSPALIIEGKRNRRIRSVWTPEDNPPPPPKRAKIEEVESVLESTPELSTDEEEDDEEEDDDDEAVAEPEDPNRVRPPFLLRGTLRPYQQAGLEWLASLYANKMNGILADEMGLGKTIQTISLLGHLACDKGVWGQHLIIVPTSVILNWEMEFKKFLPGMKVLTYYGNQKERKEKRIGWHTENTWQVCITSYQIVLADQHIFRRKSWVYMILDEAHNIKNFRSQRWQTLLGFKAQRRLLLTGTPLQNNLMELWSLLYFLMPNGVTADATAVVGFANHKEFSEWFSNPMDKAVETGDVLDEETLETVSKLHTLLRPFILRRLKSEVETQLPGKFEHVVYCRLSKRQRFLYDEFMGRASTKEALTSGGYLGVVNTLMQLRKVCNHPDLFEVRPVRTSFAMERSILSDFEPKELLVRRRLLEKEDELDLDAWNLTVTAKETDSAWAWRSRQRLDASDLLPHAIQIARRGKQPAPPKVDTRTVEGWLKYRAYAEDQSSIARWRHLRDINRLRCASKPIYGFTFLDMLQDIPHRLLPENIAVRTKSDMIDQFIPPIAPLVHSFADRAKQVAPILDYYAVIPPNVVARDVPQYALPGLTPTSHPRFLESEFDTLHQATVKLQIAFPDASLLQYDCGKLQKLDEMLRHLKTDGHRVLIFTQMTRVLDILEMFLSYNGHRYLRLDGSTKIEDRQIITERFNSDPRIFCFIASSRSGGVGINLTGADTVFFYDSDWNPSMDRQCMDRAHRIGQTREVHIYRFVSSHTVEENMLKKANQKRLLDRVVIQEGEFTTDFFGKMDWRDIIETDKPAAAEATAVDDERVEDVDVEGTPMAIDAEAVAPQIGEEREFARALAEVEDEEDVEAARVAQGEGELDFAEFADGQAQAQAAKREAQRKGFIAEQSGTPMEGSATPAPQGGDVEEGDGVDGVDEEGEGEEEEEEVGAVDEYMLRLVEWEWEGYFSAW